MQQITLGGQRVPAAALWHACRPICSRWRLTLLACRPARPPAPHAQSHDFIKAAAPHLVPVLLEQLTKQEEGQEQDESVWNLAMSSGTCLGLIARVAGNDVVPVVRGGASWATLVTSGHAGPPGRQRAGGAPHAAAACAARSAHVPATIQRAPRR